MSTTLWTEADSVFIHEMMRIQVTFLLLLYYDSGARLGAFLENGMAAVKRKDGQKDTLMFEGLRWKVRRYPYGHRSPRRSIRRLTISQDVHVYLFPLPDGSTEVILKGQNTDDPEHTLDARQASPRKARKRTNTEYKFIEWSPSRKGRSLNPLTSRAKASNRRNESPKVDLTEMTFIEWSPATKAGVSHQLSGQDGGPCTDGPAISAQLSPNHYPEPNWDSRSVTAVDESDGAPDDRALLDLPPESHNQCDGLLTGDFSDDALWLDDVSWTENSTSGPSSVSTPMTTSVLDAFEDVLDPALLCSEDSTSQPPASGFSQEILTSPSDGEDDDLDSPSLDSLLRITPAPLSSEPDKELGSEKLTVSTVQIQGWTEVVGPDGTPILQELPDHEHETQARRTRDKRKEQWPVTRAVVRKRVPVPNNNLLPKKSCRVTAKRPRCRDKGLQRPKRRSKRLN